MKKLLVLIFIVFSSIQLFSQVDQKAKSILDKVSEKTKSYPSITATFDFTMQNEKAGINETSSGTLSLQKDKYKLSVSGVEIYCDGKTQWTYMSEADEVNVSDAGSDEGSINPATIFTIYEKGFKNSYIGEGTSGAKKTHKIELVPTTKLEFSKLIIEIDQSTFQILSAKMFGKDGNIYVVKVKTFTTSTNYPASAFIFDVKKHPEVNVVDMR